MSFPFTGYIKVDEDGDLVLEMQDRGRIKEYINETFKEEDKIWVTLALPTKERTHKQFKYLHGVVYSALLDWLMLDNMETIDGMMRKKFLTVNKDTRLEYVRSLSNLTRKELAEYIDDVVEYARDSGLTIKEPERDDNG